MRSGMTRPSTLSGGTDNRPLQTSIFEASIRSGSFLAVPFLIVSPTLCPERRYEVPAQNVASLLLLSAVH
jgi:hypothetical protein